MEKPHLPKSVTQVVKLYDPRTWREKGLWWTTGLFLVTYLSNDMTPPGIFLDNIPNWEFGALTELRDLNRAMRNEFSRSQTQSVEDKDLQVADPQFSYDSESWILPSTESEYRRGIDPGFCRRPSPSIAAESMPCTGISIA